MTNLKKITALYAVLFDRAPDNSGLTYWVNVLNAGLTDLTGIANAFISTDLFQSLSGDLSAQSFVENTYSTLFDGEGDADGMAYWAEQIERGLDKGAFISSVIEITLNYSSDDTNPLNEMILARQAIVNNKIDVGLHYVEKMGAFSDISEQIASDVNVMLNNPVYIASQKAIKAVNASAESLIVAQSNVNAMAIDFIMADTKNVEKITGLYAAVFNRSPDKDGLEFWIKQLKADPGSYNDIAGFFISTLAANEQSGELNNDQFITHIYQGLFGHAGDTEGIGFWVGKLNEGMDRSELVATIVNAVYGYENEPNDTTHPSIKEDIDSAIIPLTVNSPAVNEGETVTFTVDASHLSLEGKALAYSIDGIGQQELSVGLINGHIILNDQGIGSVTLQLAADQLTQGNRALTLKLDDAPQNELSILVKDTSKNPVEPAVNPEPTGNGEIIAAYGLNFKYGPSYEPHYKFADDNRIDSLLYGQQWGYGAGQGVELTYSFPTQNSHWEWGYGDGQQHSNFISFNEEHRQAVRDALKTWSDIANVRFVEVEDNHKVAGDLRFGFSSKQNDGAAGSAYYPTVGSQTYDSETMELLSYTVNAESGDVWMNSSKYNDAHWSEGSHNFKVLLHEVGHALGLKHSFDPKRGNSSVLPEHEDNSKYSIMAYATHPDMKRIYDPLPDENGAYHWSTLGASSPMLYDTLAIQHLYGANVETNLGDDIYTFSADTPFFQTIWDAGGNDTLDASNQTVGARIDLNEGAFSSIGIRQLNKKTITKAVDNVAIAFGTQIENANGSAFDDIFIGNNLDNIFRGNGGSDVAYGGGGTNTFIFENELSSYEISGSIDHAFVTDGKDIVELIGIEMLLFSDQLYVL